MKIILSIVIFIGLISMIYCKASVIAYESIDCSGEESFTFILENGKNCYHSISVKNSFSFSFDGTYLVLTVYKDTEICDGESVENQLPYGWCAEDLLHGTDIEEVSTGKVYSNINSFSTNLS